MTSELSLKRGENFSARNVLIQKMEIGIEKLQLMSMMIPKVARQMYVETCKELQYAMWLNPEHRNRRRKTEVYKILNVLCLCPFELHTTVVRINIKFTDTNKCTFY